MMRQARIYHTPEDAFQSGGEMLDPSTLEIQNSLEDSDLQQDSGWKLVEKTNQHDVTNNKNRYKN